MRTRLRTRPYRPTPLPTKSASRARRLIVVETERDRLLLRLGSERGDLDGTMRLVVAETKLAGRTTYATLETTTSLRGKCFNLGQFLPLLAEPDPLSHMLGALRDGQLGAMQVLGNLP